MAPLASTRRRRLALALGAAILAAAAGLVVIGTSGGTGRPPPPVPGTARPARSGNPFAYVASRQAEFVARATAGNAHVLFVKSPGGVLATAARVAAFRPLIDAAAAGTNIDPDLLEGIVFLESAGRPNVIAGGDPADAAGLTQILAQTGQSLLGMNIDIGRSRRLTSAIARASALGNGALVARLERRRAGIDERFDPRKALAATVRYLEVAQQRFGREDLDVVSYHMGIGNLEQVLAEYDGGRAVPYVQLFFDTAPDRHAAAYDLLAGFGDDSRLYYWRVLGAVAIMRLYRTDRAALARTAALQIAVDSSAEVLHPPDVTPPFADPGALYDAYAKRILVPLPSNAAELGLAYDPGMGALASQLGVSPAIYRGLRPAAFDMLIELAARVRALSGKAAPLTVASAVTDDRYQQQLGVADPPDATGYTFTIARRYVSRRQVLAFQAMLDRLQALNLIAWQRFSSVIEVTVASDASQAI
ncbi:MAG: transglycosylase SLT domain-containing protein, partial [Solirubrobacterales bacterium]|nr:transglycosylase SLT domain-containing protein [Solirubrobacterales bacterium]